MGLTYAYRSFHPTTAQHTFISATYGIFYKIDHILEHKASLNKYRKIEIITCIFSDHNAIELEYNNKSNSRKYAKNGG
jgi:endonuclease/exonuclease/phosphatase family metal-dependent hydrolase